MAEENFLQPIPREEFNSASLTGSYQVVNTSGFPASLKILKIWNDANVPMNISFNGSTAHDFAPAKSGFVLDAQANHQTEGQSSAGTKYLRKGTKLYVSGTAGSGNLYVMGYY